MKQYIKPATEELDIDAESMIAASPTSKISIDEENEASVMYEILSKERNDTYSLWD